MREAIDWSFLINDSDIELVSNSETAVIDLVYGQTQDTRTPRRHSSNFVVKCCDSNHHKSGRSSASPLGLLDFYSEMCESRFNLAQMH